MQMLHGTIIGAAVLASLAAALSDAHTLLLRSLQFNKDPWPWSLIFTSFRYFYVGSGLPLAALLVKTAA